jgi:uncharacterized protein YfiM (DUF2279 family)
MHRCLLVGLLMLAATPLDAQTHPKIADPWFGADKVKHFLMAGFVESLTFAGLEAAGANRSSSRAAGLAAAVVVSVGREIHDRRPPKRQFSVKDLLWDGLGTTAALLVINKTRR